PSNNISPVCDTHNLSIMAIAFDRACDLLPVQFSDSDYMRRKLAPHIIRLAQSANVIAFAASTAAAARFSLRTAMGSRLAPSPLRQSLAGRPRAFGDATVFAHELAQPP